ncbi:uncharacterized protein [Lepeophtheirus salmonis]|uniref:Uncharacterized protein n=1 Tax=Lepeophtheirus salmonis TaxID=72036 RepID=A0A0K2T817_LEPSM|nr:uncharacterized protein LOC121114835 [Lepeophtheirus salmonis]
MGVIRSLVNVFVATIGVFIYFTAHTIYQVEVATPGAPSLDDWPVSFNKDKIDGIVKSRQPLIAALKEFDSKSNWKSIITDDIVFEAPVLSITGANDFILFVEKFTQYKSEFTVVESLGEYHNAQEILLDWNIKWGIEGLRNFNQHIRFRVFIESPNKIFKIVEEWNGNPLLNEKTTNGFLGKFHSKFRMYTGQMLVMLMKIK